MVYYLLVLKKMIANTYKTLEAKNLARERTRLKSQIKKHSKTQKSRYGKTPNEYLLERKERLTIVENRLKYLGYNVD